MVCFPSLEIWDSGPSTTKGAGLEAWSSPPLVSSEDVPWFSHFQHVTQDLCEQPPTSSGGWSALTLWGAFTATLREAAFGGDYSADADARVDGDFQRGPGWWLRWLMVGCKTHGFSQVEKTAQKIEWWSHVTLICVVFLEISADPRATFMILSHNLLQICDPDFIRYLFPQKAYRKEQIYLWSIS